MDDFVRSSLCVVLLTLACTAAASGPEDPTRPPPGFSETAADPAAVQEAPLNLTSLFLMGRQPYAVIDGLVVRLGDRLGNGRVTRIDETGVRLKTPEGVRHLKLLPDVEKRTRTQGEKR